MSLSSLKPAGINVHLSEQYTPHRTYVRAHDLPRLLPMWPKDLADLSVAGRERVIATLRRALKAERQRGLAGHWAYDLARHAQLLAAYRTECAALNTLRSARVVSRTGNDPI